MMRNRIAELLALPLSNERSFQVTPPEFPEVLTDYENLLGVTFTEDLRWFAVTYGSIYSFPGMEFLFLSGLTHQADITFHFRSTEGLPEGFVVFEYDAEVVGGCWIVDPSTNLVHTWNSYECNGLSPSFGPFLSYVVEVMEQLTRA
jgi:SMI1-KNR4 cell-wall